MLSAALMVALILLYRETVPTVQAFPIDAPRPIAVRNSLFLEDLTWMEIRDAIRSGKTTVIVPTGGIEQSGPYLPVGKHNFILERTMTLLAEQLGDALIAPIVKYVPEGDVSPPTGHMRFPGTISLREETFVAVLKDIARSLEVHGFRHIVFLGDSGDNMSGLKTAAEQFNAEHKSPARVLFVPEYYNYRFIESWLAGKGYTQQDEGIHDDLAFTSELLAIAPELVRYDERAAASKLFINGISLADKERFITLGAEIMKMRANLTAERIRAESIRANASTE